MCAVPQMDVTLCVQSASIHWWTLKDPTVSFVKRRRAIAGTPAKFKIPALIYSSRCISGRAASPANDATRSLVLHIKEEGRDLLFIIQDLVGCVATLVMNSITIPMRTREHSILSKTGIR